MSTGISGPGFVSLMVRDLATATAFYEQKVGLKIDPQPFPGAVGFKTAPIPFALIQAPPSVNLASGPGVSVWLKASDGQAAHDALSQAGVTIVKAPYDGPFGRTFVFVDPDGYSITVYEQDEPIVERFPPR